MKSSKLLMDKFGDNLGVERGKFSPPCSILPLLFLSQIPRMKQP